MAHRNRWLTVLKNGEFPWQTVKKPEGTRNCIQPSPNRTVLLLLHFLPHCFALIFLFRFHHATSGGYAMRWCPHHKIVALERWPSLYCQLVRGKHSIAVRVRINNPPSTGYLGPMVVFLDTCFGKNISYGAYWLEANSIHWRVQCVCYQP